MEFANLIPFWKAFLSGLLVTVELSVIAIVGGLLIGIDCEKQYSADAGVESHCEGLCGNVSWSTAFDPAILRILRNCLSGCGYADLCSMQLCALPVWRCLYL